MIQLRNNFWDFKNKIIPTITFPIIFHQTEKIFSYYFKTNFIQKRFHFDEPPFHLSEQQFDFHAKRFHSSEIHFQIQFQITHSVYNSLPINQKLSKFQITWQFSKTWQFF